MTRILKTTYMDFYPANSNQLIFAPVFDGLNYVGCVPVKGNWHVPQDAVGVDV